MGVLVAAARHLHPEGVVVLCGYYLGVVLVYDVVGGAHLPAQLLVGDDGEDSLSRTVGRDCRGACLFARQGSSARSASSLLGAVPDVNEL